MDTGRRSAQIRIGVAAGAMPALILLFAAGDGAVALVLASAAIATLTVPQIPIGVMAGALLLVALLLLLAAGGEGAALVVAVLAIAALVLSYMRVGVLIARASRDERARKRLGRERRHHMRVMLCAPLIVFAFHPWGLDTFGVMLAVGLLCQAVFVQAAATMVLMRERRVRLRRERRERWAQNRRARGATGTHRSV